MSRNRHRPLTSVIAVIGIVILPLVLLPWQQQSLHAEIHDGVIRHTMVCNEAIYNLQLTMWEQTDTVPGYG